MSKIDECLQSLIRSSAHYIQSTKDTLYKTETLPKSPSKHFRDLPPSIGQAPIALRPLINFESDPYAYQKLVYLYDSLARLHQQNIALYQSFYESQMMITVGNFAGAMAILESILHASYLPPELIPYHQSIENYLRLGA